MFYIFTSLLFLFFLIKQNGSNELKLCPRQCDCDVHNGYNRANCEYQNIVNVYIGVPEYVQIYSLKHNAIYEIDNNAFKGSGYDDLIELNLAHNLIFWIGLNAFSGLKKLRYINLSTNRLQSIQPDLFWYNALLESLDLSGNMFQNVKDEPFLTHSGLKKLNLSNSRIPFVPVKFFTGLPQLEIVDFSDNYMVVLDLGVLKPLNHLIKINLRNNPWKCNDKFKEVEQWVLAREIQNYEVECVIQNEKNAKLFEKIISMVNETELGEVDVKNVWNIANTSITFIGADSHKTMAEMHSLEDSFNERFPAFWCLIFGLQMGFLIGMFGTYFWLASICKCNKIVCRSAREIAQDNLEAQRANERESDSRTNLLRQYMNTTEDDGPGDRRQNSYRIQCANVTRGGLTTIREDRESVRESTTLIILPSRAETPPPPYHECTRDLQTV